MATPSYFTPTTQPPVQNPVVVISPQFCVGYPVDLTIVRKMMTWSEGHFGVTDVNGNVMFKVKGKFLTLHDRRVMLDAADNPIVTFQQKVWTARRRWQVFRGESTDEKDMIFSVRKSSYFQMKTKLEVFMASNTSEDVCDYKIEGSWLERSCVIYAGETDNIIAQMRRNYTGVTNILIGKDSFGVTVYPNIDHAFITALVVLLEEINEDRKAS